MVKQEKNIRSSSIATSSETSHVDQEKENENAPVVRLRLPTELILALARYLPTSSYMSMSYSCRTSGSQRGVSSTLLPGDKIPMEWLLGTILSIESRTIRYLERLDLWSMYGNIPSWQAFYNGRRLTHDYSLRFNAMICTTQYEAPLLRYR